jgi:predicted Zn-dependent protease
VAEAKQRAALLPQTRSLDSVSYGLSRERLRVLTLPSDRDPRELYQDAVGVDAQVADYRYYGRALALINANAAAEAVPILRDLVARHQDVIQYHTALGQAQLAAGDPAGSLRTFAQARGLFPRNVPVTVRYAETLMRTGDAKQAHAVLLDVFNVIPPTPDQVRLLALAANSAGDTAEAYYYLGEYNIMNGDLPQAINQLQLALATPTITPVQRARFKARRDELKEYLPPKTQMIVDRGEPLPVPDPRSESDQASGRRSR